MLAAVREGQRVTTIMRVQFVDGRVVNEAWPYLAGVHLHPFARELLLVAFGGVAAKQRTKLLDVRAIQHLVDRRQGQEDAVVKGRCRAFDTVCVPRFDLSQPTQALSAAYLIRLQLAAVSMNRTVQQ